ncbi:UNVERIFIED_CONTAM: FRIGIDA-like protein 1 [Sesamum radiatum]|uniref:FRIGIDA-like protein n=1 Tax=Sesamum radiatum TaxID=300843 RepID=A0AAW2KIF7_SESRA
MYSMPETDDSSPRNEEKHGYSLPELLEQSRVFICCWKEYGSDDCTINREALNLVDGKKENLKKAFEELQSRSSLLSSLNFTWPDLDSYFRSIQTELLQQLSTLQALESSQTQKIIEPVKRKDSLSSEPVPARPELKSLCENMDGLGLRKYVVERPKERTAVRVELADAFKHAPDPGSMILDALEGFWDGKTGNGSRLRTACVVLLEELMRAGVKMGPEVRNVRGCGIGVEGKDGSK